MEYSSASDIPGSARSLFGPSLYNGSIGRGFASEIASTSPLPEPTRVEGQDFVSGVTPRNVVGGSGPARQQYLQPAGGSSAGSLGNVQLDVPFVYSDEELAVLAESFFNQKDGFDAGIGSEWWNTGNL